MALIVVRGTLRRHKSLIEGLMGITHGALDYKEWFIKG